MSIYVIYKIRKKYAVYDMRGMKRISEHKLLREAKAEVERLNKIKKMLFLRWLDTR